MADEELTIKDYEIEIKNLIDAVVSGEHVCRWYIKKLKNRGFGLRVNITLIEEEDPLYSIIARKPIYRLTKTTATPSGYTNFDFDFFQKYKIFPPPEPPIAAQQPEEDRLLLKIKSFIIEALDEESGRYLQLIFKKYGIGIRISLLAIQEDEPRTIVDRKSIKLAGKKRKSSEFTEDDLAFLKKNRLIGP